MTAIIIWSVVTGIAIGMYIHMTFIRRLMKNSPNELINAIMTYHNTHADEDDDDEDIDDPNSIIVSYELVNTHWYLYDVSTKVFAGQGKSLEEAVEAVKSRFPTKDVVVQQVKEAV